MRSPFTCRLPHVMLQPSLPRRSAAKAGPSQSNSVKPSQTKGWRQLVATNTPRHLPPRPAAYGYGLRLWQSPAAALRPARHLNLNENSRDPIRHSSFVIRLQKKFPRIDPLVNRISNLRFICAARPMLGSVAQKSLPSASQPGLPHSGNCAPSGHSPMIRFLLRGLLHA